MIDVAELRLKRVVYEVPGMDQVVIDRDVAYKRVDGTVLGADIYHPAEPGSVPTVVLVAGSGSWEVLQDIKDWGIYQSYGELLAASGLGAVTFNHRSPSDSGLPAVAADVDDLISWVRNHAGDYALDPHRVAVWAFSGGPPFGLRSILRDSPPFVRCIATYYGVMDYRHVIDDMQFSREEDPVEFSPAASIESRHDLPPVLLAKAGLDQPWLNASIDRFVATALRQNLTLDLMTHPSGHHSFDTLNNDSRSQEIIRHTLAFLADHLQATRSDTADDRTQES